MPTLSEMNLPCLFRRYVVLPWDLERSHALISLGYGAWIWFWQSFNGPGPGGKMLAKVAQRIAPDVDAEAVWGSLLILTGLLTVAGLLGGSPKTRRNGAFLRCVVWGLMSGCFYVALPSSPGGFTWAALSFSALMCALQIPK